MEEHKDNNVLYCNGYCFECNKIRTLLYGYSNMNEVPEFPELFDSETDNIEAHKVQSIKKIYNSLKKCPHIKLSKNPEYITMKLPYNKTTTTISHRDSGLKWHTYHDCRKFYFSKKGLMFILMPTVAIIKICKKDDIRMIIRAS